MSQSNNKEVARLADHLERSVHGGAWHGPATREALEGIDATTAGRRPIGSAHTIVDLVRHITFWLDAANVRILGGTEADPDDDWPDEGVLTDGAWDLAVTELERACARLHGTVLDMDDRRLNDCVPGSDPTVRGMLLGVLQHTAYHTGQIVRIARELSK